MTEPNRRVLITGVLGFIPSSLAANLLERGYVVGGLDNLLTGRAENIAAFKDDPNFTYVEGDANSHEDLKKLFQTVKPDYVYHYAACVGVKRTLENPMLVLDDVHGFEPLLNLCCDHDVKRVFFSSSSEVYGEPVELPQREYETPLNSKLPYAVVKNLGEVFLKTWQTERDLDYTIFRFFNTYGPRQSPDFVVSRFIKQALQGEPITIYGDGSQSRTFCYIDDNVETTVAAIDDPSTVNSIINVGSDRVTSVLELANTIIEITGSKSEVVHLPPLKEGDMTRRQPDTALMRKVLKDRPLVPLDEGLKETLQYIQSSLIEADH